MNKNRATLEELQRLAKEKYGERLTIKGEAFIIDGIRLFVPADQLRRAEPPELLILLGVQLDNERKARTVSETV
jgi:hypothetical protein